MKSPFKKQSAMDTLVNVGIGGAANVAMDYLVQSVDALASLEQTTINAIKIGVGVLGGTMTSNKYIRAAVDGVAVVGVSNLINGLMEDETPSPSSEQTAAGLPQGTIGRLRAGNRAFTRRGKVAGFAGVMGC